LEEGRRRVGERGGKRRRATREREREEEEGGGPLTSWKKATQSKGALKSEEMKTPLLSK